MESKSPGHSAPVALTIAGSDSGANAGVQADLLTFAANGVYGTSAITCVTAQNPESVASIHPIPPSEVASQIRQVVSFYNPNSIKTGMLYNANIIQAVSSAITALKPNCRIVVDPVMIATSGTPLIDEAAIDALKSLLFPLADLITPNLDEAEELLGNSIRNSAEVEAAAQALSSKFETAVLLKGGHLSGRELLDTLSQPGKSPVAFTQERIDDINTHGSGCTLSAAIAAWLARGFSLVESVSRGRDYLRTAMKNPLSLKGVNYINHFP